jgi:hypothetical protein
MARPRERPPGHETVNLWSFALPALAEIQEKAQAKGMPKPSRDNVASAMVWTAASLPPEVCKAMIEAYIAAERDAHDEIAKALEVFFRS